MKESMSVAKTLALNLIPKDILEKIETLEDKDKLEFIFIVQKVLHQKMVHQQEQLLQVALISLLCDIPVLNTIALTGEISLNGHVMPAWEV